MALHTCSDRKTSLLGLPILSPDHAIVHAWTAIITLVDLTYTAFLVPISIAFDQIRKGSHLSWLTITDIVGCRFDDEFFMYMMTWCICF